MDVTWDGQQVSTTASKMQLVFVSGNKHGLGPPPASARGGTNRSVRAELVEILDAGSLVN